MNIFFRTYSAGHGRQSRNVMPRPTVSLMRDVAIGPLEPAPGRRWRNKQGRTYRWNTVQELVRAGLVEISNGRVVEVPPAGKAQEAAE